ncbi:MAG TPA: hypothetical protein VN083_04145 [Vicinamibacteria bacterium]|jgi:hypothetical protein|nr:hypothetical protein [Vicinamibacteria bacterium]
MGDLVAIVTVTRRGARGGTEVDVPVKSLEELFAACRDAPPSDLVRICLKGREGEVRLNFASFIRSG